MSIKVASYAITHEQRERLTIRLSEILSLSKAIEFAYLYGSAIDQDAVHDIDVGIYLDEASSLEQSLTLSADLASHLTAVIRIPVDVRILNHTPTTFLYHVLRGRLLMCQNEPILTTLMEDVARRYLDMAPLLRLATKEAFSA